MTDDGLYVGEVTHGRVHGIRHGLRYRVFMLLLDLDRLDATLDRLRLLRRGRFGLLSFRPQDHGDRSDRPLRAQVEAHLNAAGIDLEGGPVRLLTMPRILGYGFNPISLYFCHRPDGSLAAILYEVTNTFHERHAYLVAVPAGAASPIRQEADKALFVSPLMDMDLTYDFLVRPPGEAVRVSVTARRDAQPILTAIFAGHRRPLTDRELLRAWMSHPLLTWKVIWGIHWEALISICKGARYRSRGAPPDHAVTVGRERPALAATERRPYHPG